MNRARVSLSTTMGLSGGLMAALLCRSLAAALLLVALPPFAYAATAPTFTITLDCTNGTSGTTGSATVDAAHVSRQGTLVTGGNKTFSLSCTPGGTSSATTQPKGPADRFAFQVMSPNAPGQGCGGVKLFSEISTTPTTERCDALNSAFPNITFVRD